MKRPRGTGDNPSLGELAGIGVLVAVLVSAGMAGGYCLSSATHLGFVGILLGLVVGVAASVAAAYSRIKRYL